MRRAVLALSLVATAAWGQRAISAHSGMVNYVEGTVQMDGKSVEPKVTELPEVKNKSVLETLEGRAEVLLTPGAFLRLAENSSFRMISNQLWNTRIEILSGSALVEVEELLKDNTITVQYGDAEMALAKKGLYRIDAGEPGRFRVYDGEARVSLKGDGTTAHKGRQIELGAVLSASNFETKDTDSFYNWSARRAEYIATANISSARSAGTSSSSFGFAGSQWAFNPWYGMYTFVPGLGYGYSPFGYSIYSPYTVSYLYTPAYYGLVGGGGVGAGAPRLGTGATPRYSNPVAPRMGTRPVATNTGFDMGSPAAAPVRGSGGAAPISGGAVASGGMASGGGAVAAHGGSRGR